MRKYLAVLLGVIFILSLSVTAYAIHEPDQPQETVISAGGSKITLGGKIISRGWYDHNVGIVETDSGDYLLPVESNSEAIYFTNVYLMVDAKITDNVQAYVELETAAGDTSDTSGVYYWGSLDSKPNSRVVIRQAWMQYTGSGLLGMPAGVKLGHTLITLGEKIWFDTSRFGTDGILVWVDPMKELHLVLHTLKLNEGSVSPGTISHSDDLDAYGIVGSYMLDKDNTLGMHFTWVKSDVAGEDPEELNIYNFAVHGNGKIAGLSYAAEADFQFGKIKMTTEEDMKFKGWGAIAKLGYMLDPVNIRASFAYGSGDSDAEDNDIKEFQTVVTTPGDGTGPVARFAHYTSIYERLIKTAAHNQVLTGNELGTGIANTTFYNLGFDIKPLKELSISLDGYLLRASKTDLWEAETGESVNKNIGWEIDTKISYKLAKNLTYFIEAGVFKPNDFYQDAFDISEKTTTMAVHGLSLTF
ncbi:MAG: alginate export family protein [Nitrospirota bacterium]